jgi:hypothetical protein
MRPAFCSLLYRMYRYANGPGADCRVIVAEQRHHVFCIRAFYESGEPAQVTEERGNLSTVAL